MPPPRDPSSSGLLSNVFSFVAREFESFVVTAKGGQPSENAPKASSSRQRLDNRSSRANSAGVSRKTTSRGRVVESGREKHRRNRTTVKKHRLHDASDIEKSPSPPSRKNDSRKHSKYLSPSPRSPRSPSSRKTSQETSQPAPPSPQQSPSPPPIPRMLQRRPSITMPGSLFPRSPSMEPTYASLDENERRVRFAAGIVSPVHHSYEELLAGSKAASSSHGSSPSRDPSVSPVNIKGGPSVRDAVGQFDEDGDPSIMLPNPSTSPARGTGTPTRSRPPSETGTPPRSNPAKGKERAFDWDYDFSISEANTSGVLRVMGKERELHEARAQHLRTEQEMDPDESAFIEARERDQERIRLLEGEVAQLKRQLAEQREQRLASSKPNSSSDPPPIPPPPPPPPMSGSSLTPFPLTVAGIRSRSGSSSATDSFLVSARASLKPTTLPVEVPANSITHIPRTRKLAHPTVNVPSDKMAAFLDEVKNAKLKRTGSSTTLPLRPHPGDSSILSMSAGQKRDILRDLARRRSLNSLRSSIAETHIGEKRKRVDEGVEPDARASKRLQPNSGITSKPSNSSGSSLLFEPPHTSTSSNFFFDRIYPSISTAGGIGIATPSLTSDNERESSEISPRDRLPSTPPGAQDIQGPDHIQVASQGRDDVYDHFDDDREASITPSPSPKIRATTNLNTERPSPKHPNADSGNSTGTQPFSRRVPSSPLPTSTPRKALAPARTRPRSWKIIESDSEDEDLTLMFSPPHFELLQLPEAPTTSKVAESPPLPPPRLLPAPVRTSPPPVQPSRIPKRKDQKESIAKLSVNGGGRRDPVPSSSRDPDSNNQPSGRPLPSNNHVRRRRTLDQEIQLAGNMLWDDDANAGDDEDNGDSDDGGMEVGVLTAVGTQSRKKGFLKGGGAGGKPVFMGPGYVQGAEEVEEVFAHAEPRDLGSRKQREKRSVQPQR